MIQTEFPFTLPKGLVIEDTIVRNGTMRLATAQDEIEAMKHPLSCSNPEYVSIVVLSRVVRFEKVEVVTVEMLQKLFITDFDFLQNLYTTINQCENPSIRVTCPYCGKTFEEPVNYSQEK